ncbi:MAG: response regulator [Geitlerinemataceae cyanobacterium]
MDDSHDSQTLVLIVDDCYEDRLTYKRYLSRDLELSYKFVEAESGEEGLALAQQRPPDCILLDYQLPDTDGLEFITEYKIRLGENHPPVVILTGQGDESVAVQAMKLGAQDYLVKGKTTAESLQIVVRNAIEKSHLRQQLDRSSAQLRLLELAVESANDIVLITDAEPIDLPGPRIVYVNQAFTQQTGYTREEVLGKTPRILQGAKTERATLDVLRHALENWQSARVELINYRKDGSEFWVELNIVPIADDKGIFTHWVSVQRDITDRIHAATEREHLLARERQSRQQAETANRLKDEFLSILSHEIRTPLNSILGWATMLRQRQLDPAITERALETIERNARIQAQLIDDLLDVSRIIRGKLKLDFHEIPLAAVIRAAVETMEPAAQAKEIELVYHFESQTDRVRGDFNRLQQVVWNLVANAVKFTPRQGRVDVRLQRIGFYLEMQVSDTGMGIVPEFLPYVFDRFSQAEQSTNRSFNGLGLGLAIVRHLVELHGGTVAVHSAGENQGATFSVQLPVLDFLEGDRTQQDSPPQGCPVSLQDLRVLVVDDDEDSRQMLAIILEQCGAKVWTVASAAEARRAIVREVPDVLLSDIGMPGEDGYDLIGQVKSLESKIGRKIPAAAITAYAGATDCDRILAAGFLVHITKPIEPELFIEQVAHLGGRSVLDKKD